MTLDLFATEGRIEGRLHASHLRAPIPFSGVLELLHAVEELHLELCSNESTDPSAPRKGLP